MAGRPAIRSALLLKQPSTFVSSFAVGQVWLHPDPALSVTAALQGQADPRSPDRPNL